MKKVRAFLALDAPGELRDRLEWIRDSYLQFCKDRGLEHNPTLRWTAKQNLHLTVQFIGDVSWTEVGEIALDFDRRISRRKVPGFAVSYEGFDCFDRVMFMRLSDGGEQLARLQGEFRKTLAGGGVEFDRRPFKGHLTLARSRRSLRREPGRDLLKKFLPELSFSCGVQRLTLYESRLGPKGPTYLSIKEFYLD